MARPTIQDKPPKTAATSFERQPSSDLEDTRPFSLLNALLEGVEGAALYEPPSFEELADDSSPALEIEASEKEAPPPSEEKSDTKPDIESTESLSSESSPEDETEEPTLTETKSTAELTESATKEAASESTNGSPQLPFSFPKISGELPPPPPPPRPKSRRFSTTTPPFSKLAERSKSRSEGPQTEQRWPRRGFQGGKVEKSSSFDPINKAIRIFESLSTDSEEESAPPQAKAPLEESAPPATPVEERKPTEEPEAKQPAPIETEPPPEQAPPISEAPLADSGAPAPEAPPEETPEIDDIAEIATVKIKVPKTKLSAPPAQAPTPKPQVPQGLAPSEPSTLRPPDGAEQVPSPEPIVETTVPAEVEPPPASEPTPSPPSIAKTTVHAEAGTPPPSEPAAPTPSAPPLPVPVRRRRRRRVPLNPWTAKRTTALEEKREDRRKHIDKTLGELAKMLEATLQTSTSSTSREEAPTTKVTLKAAFPESEDTSPTVPASRVRLVPRSLSKSDTENAASKPQTDLTKPSDFEITAPTTLVAENAPISPFTKVAQGQTRDTQPATSAPVAPGVPDSPFTLANTQNVVSQAPTPPSEPSQPKVFASPFSAALKKREEHSSSSGESTSTPAATPGLKIAPISPPGTHPDQEAALAKGQLPAPTYSFATMGLPSAQGKVPSTAPPQAVTQAPIPSQVPPTSAPVAPSPFTPKANTADLEVSPETNRKERPRPEQETWGILTWALCIVCTVVSVAWMYEIYRTLSEAELAPIPQGEPDAITEHPQVLAPDGETPDLPNEPTLDRPDVNPPPPSVSLKAPIDCVVSFIDAKSEAIRDQHLIEDEDLHERMIEHYDSFPMQASTSRKITDSGEFQDTGRSYVTVNTTWADEHQSDTVLVKDEQGDYHFSWYAFEQARSQLLRRYAETEWTGWTQFFINIKPIDPATLPPGSVLDNVYYRITVPEDPEFEAVGYVDGLSSMAMEFKERFPNTSTYQVIADLMRGERLPEDSRPLFRITRLIRASWDATP